MDKIILRKLILKAKKGNKKAVEKLYEESKNNIYFTCLKLVNNEQDALDLAQETFITSFQKLDTLKDENTYFAWQKMIAINKCKNYLQKNKPVLFKNDEDENTTFDIMDTDEEFIPHAYVDNKAKRNIVMDIIDNELSDAQRITIMLFYYEEQTIKKIATILNCSEGTVKSRLNSAKKLIKDAVLKEEKRGNKLYSVAPIPVLGLLLRESAKECTIPAEISGAILEAVKLQFVQSNSVGVITKLVTTIKGMTVTNLVITGLVSTTVVTGAGYAVVKNIQADESTEKLVVQTTLCGVEFKEIKEIQESFNVDNIKFSNNYDIEDIKTLELKDGVLHVTLDTEIKDEAEVYSTLKILKEQLQSINKDAFKNDNIKGIEFIVEGKKNSWLMQIDDKLSKIKIEK